MQKPTLEEALQDKEGRFIKLNNSVKKGEARLDLKFIEAKVYNDYYKTFKALNAASQANKDCVSFSFVQYSTGFFSVGLWKDQTKGQFNTQFRSPEFTKAIRQGQLRALQQLASEAAPAEPTESGIKMLKFPFMDRKAMDGEEQEAWDEVITALKTQGLSVYQTDDKGFGKDTIFQPFFL